MLAQRINEPDFPWPRAEARIDRFLTKLVGLRLPSGSSTAAAPPHGTSPRNPNS